MSDRIFRCGCQKCGIEFEFTGSYEKFNDFMNSKNFACPSGHRETRSPSGFLKIMTMSEPLPILEWKPGEGRTYVNVLDYDTARNNGMQMVHLGSGLYIDQHSRKKYDYEEDSKGNRHYYEIAATAIGARNKSSPDELAEANDQADLRVRPKLKLTH